MYYSLRRFEFYAFATSFWSKVSELAFEIDFMGTIKNPS